MLESLRRSLWNQHCCLQVQNYTLTNSMQVRGIKPFNSGYCSLLKSPWRTVVMGKAAGLEQGWMKTLCTRTLFWWSHRQAPARLLPPHQCRSSRTFTEKWARALGSQRGPWWKKCLRHQTVQPWGVWFEYGEGAEHVLTLQMCTQHWDGSTWLHQHHGNLQVPATNKRMRWYSICYLIQDF